MAISSVFPVAIPAGRTGIKPVLERISLSRGAKFTLFTLLLLTLIVLILSEITLRYAWTPPKKIYDYSHPYIPRKIGAGVAVAYQSDSVTGFSGEYKFQTGPLGYRTKSVLSREKEDGAYRIFFLGGSTTICSYLPLEHVFSQLVEDGLNQSGLGYEFQCANGGVDGGQTRDTLALLNQDVVLTNPDCVVVMHAINDLIAGLAREFDSAEVDRRAARSKAKRMYRDIYGAPRPYVYLFYKSLRQLHSDRFTLSHILKERHSRSEFPEQEVSSFPNVIYFEKFLRSIVGSCQACGTRVVLMTQPSLYRKDLSAEEKDRIWCSFHPKDGVNPTPESMVAGMAVYNDATRRIAAEMGAELIDLAPKVPRTLNYMYDDVHYTVEGNRRVADEVIGHFLESFSSDDPDPDTHIEDSTLPHLSAANRISY